MTVLFHCPYCGTTVKEEESYCIKCGKNLPDDMHIRLSISRRSKKVWLLPIAIIILLALSTGGFYLFLDHQTTDAKEFYFNGLKSAQKGNYEQARNEFKKAYEQKENFPQALNAIEFTGIAMKVQNKIDDAAKELAKQEYQEALNLINETESALKNYNGSVVKKLINEIVLTRNTILIEQVKNKLQTDPEISELKPILWEVESVNSSEAEKIATNIRNQIVDYTYSMASEQLKVHHFSDAEELVSEGLIYAPESKKLISLQTAINSERVAFETAQQRRIESAITTAEMERKQNKNEAVELVNVKLMNNDQGKLVVVGKVKSVATIPINTVLVEYDLLTKKGKKFKSNEVYVYPDTLYPDEIGEFEFTHFDIDNKADELKVDVTKIKWYTES
ncbi:zinc ribbon domain-containing protein [Virgibacillus sp. DJP39]|uniref:zinc ribbon domain-containing protein n=1 Tax=Virgibacillus sp. DJP39 TaxID=3409790 RepID=UPI003BB620B7